MTVSNRFFLRKLHSLSGVIPLGLFLLEHLYSNALAIFGPERYNAQIEALQRVPFLISIEILFIVLPLLYHGIYGLYVAYTGQVNVGAYGHARNWTYLAQRVTGVIVFIFVIWHVWAIRVQSLIHGTPVTFDLVSGILGNPVLFTIYAVATISAIFHFTNGLWNVAVDWGIAIGPRAQRKVWIATWALFALLGVLALRFMVAFTQGGVV